MPRDNRQEAALLRREHHGCRRWHRSCLQAVLLLDVIAAGPAPLFQRRTKTHKDTDNFFVTYDEPG
jgi:hypothetical protein